MSVCELRAWAWAVQGWGRGRGVVCLVAFGDVLIFHVIVRTHFSLDINCVSLPRALQRNLHVREEAWQEEASGGRGDSFV